MKKNYLLATALAIMTLAGCTDDSFVGDQSVKEANGSGAISFNSGTPALTRSDKTGAAAAGDLNNHFYVYGIKKESVDGAGNVQTGNLVFNNYAVNWTANSAMTTTSNTENWEYVGYTLTDKEQAKITANSGAVAQTIKYWDWGAADYTFYAFSAKPSDISGDLITVTKVQDQKTTDSPAHTVYDNGYTVTLAADASLDDLYFSERKFIQRSEGATNTDRTADNTYGGNVTFRFHNMASKVRVAMYETVPGHTVTINSFEVVDNANPTFANMTTEETGCFKANFVNNASGTAGTMTVKYVATEGATQNYPTVSFAPTSTAANILQLGDQLKANVTIGESATGATYDKTAKAYTSVFPKEDNTQNLKLKVNYTLTADGTSETITVEDATAEIPAAYLQWKPGYAYTYIFKISDNSNGYTGPTTSPAGLYPITFDAVEAIADDGKAEYITTVSEPSITTFGVKSNKYVEPSSKEVSSSTVYYEYPASTDVYATVMDEIESTRQLATISSDNFKIYEVSSSDDTNFPVTEASVAEALIEGPTWTKAQADLKKITCAGGPELTFQKTVPAEDGTTKTLDASNNKAAKFTTAATKKYALVYQKTAATYSVSAATKYATSDDFTNAGTVYTTSECTTVATSWTSADTEYYKRTAVTNKGVYAVKIVTVEP